MKQLSFFPSMVLRRVDSHAALFKSYLRASRTRSPTFDLAPSRLPTTNVVSPGWRLRADVVAFLPSIRATVYPPRVERCLVCARSSCTRRLNDYSLVRTDEMAITAVSNCLGPPPLPPGKRFLQKSKKLSSTYTSFRDPAVEAWLPRGILGEAGRRRAAGEGAISKQGLFKSCSEGDLCVDETRYATSLDKCIKAIYGSWKNLLHRKFDRQRNRATAMDLETILLARALLPVLVA